MYNGVFVQIFEYAKEKNATDVHLTAGAVPVIRMEGQLAYAPFRKITPCDTEYLVKEILNDEQKNRLKANHFISSPVVLEQIGRIRANIFMQRGSYSLNLKLLDKTLKTTEELGIPQVVLNLHKSKSGLILICGKKKTGKSTTMAVLVKKISETRACHIITVEDPIEYLYKHDEAIVNQKEVGIDVNSFEEGIYSAMTQDPDVIVISSAGEPETLSAALSAAENGHLVLTTLQTENTVKTIEHIIGMFPVDRQNYVKVQLGNVLQAVITQQLIPAKDEKGNILAQEIMLATNAMKNLIVENKFHQIPAAIKASKTLGMTLMEDSIKELLDKELISREKAKLLLTE